MRRGVLVAACSLFASGACAQGLPATPQMVEGWSQAVLDTEGWTRIGWTQGPNNTVGLVFFLSTLPNSDTGPVLRDWLRSEAPLSPKAAPQSGISLMEFDCLGRRARTLESYGFGLVNLRGRMTEAYDGPTAFSKVEPGSISETALETVCRGTR